MTSNLMIIITIERRGNSKYDLYYAELIISSIVYDYCAREAQTM